MKKEQPISMQIITTQAVSGLMPVWKHARLSFKFYYLAHSELHQHQTHKKAQEQTPEVCVAVA